MSSVEVKVKTRNFRKLLLIGISGKARSGKDTIGEYIVNSYDFQAHSFAGPIKRAVCEMFGIDMSLFETEELKEKVIPFWGYSPRQMAQMLGTEGGRDLFDSNIWVRRAYVEWLALMKSSIAMMKINKSILPAFNGMVITDVRFENEAKWIRSEGGTIIHVTRDSAMKVSNHCSENGIKPLKGETHIVNNGSLAELYDNVDLAIAKVLSGV